MNGYIPYHLPRLAAEPHELEALVTLREHMGFIHQHRFDFALGPLAMFTLVNAVNHINLAIQHAEELYSPDHRERFIQSQAAAHDAIAYVMMALYLNIPLMMDVLFLRRALGP